MNVPQSFTILELDEDLEISGRRTVAFDQIVIPLYSPPSELAMQCFQLAAPFEFVDQLEIGWFDAGDDVDYALANDSLWYLRIETIMPCSSEKEYDLAWGAFRKAHAEKLATMVGKSSWGFGNSITSRRGQGLFMVELDGLEHPTWLIHVSIASNDTYASCWNTARQVDAYFKGMKKD